MNGHYLEIVQYPVLASCSNGSRRLETVTDLVLVTVVKKLSRPGQGGGPPPGREQVSEPDPPYARLS